jgi:hypothetical protein
MLLGQPAPVYDTIVVCPAEFVDALAPWVNHRARQGHRLVRVRADQSAEAIRADIRRVAKRGGLKFIVLVGDARVGQPEPALAARTIPPHLARAKVNIHWGSEPSIASDDWYADLDDDQAPDVAIGRITADSADDVKAITAKIIAYETSRDFGVWRRRVNFVAGVGGFGRVADTVLEMGAKQLIGSGLPTVYESTMTYASLHSPYCPDPRRLAETTLARLNEGSLVWVYIGHGHPLSLDQMRTHDGPQRIFDVRDVPQLQCAAGSPIAFFMACYVGAFDAQRDCLGEEMLRAAGGPVAVVAGSRVTMPYAMSILATGMLDECFEKRTPTIGQALLAAKRRLVLEQPSDTRRASLDWIARVLSPKPDQLAEERLEHVHLFNLLGDPLLRLRYPQAMRIACSDKANAGSEIRVEGVSPIAGQCRVELIVPRDRLAFTPPAQLESQNSAERFDAMQAMYNRANDPRLASAVVDVAAGDFETTLTIPLDARGHYHIRVYVEGKSDFAAGACDLKIEQGL